MGTHIGLTDWVVKIGSSKPSSGVAHQVVSISEGYLHLGCGLRMTEAEVLDVVDGETSQDKCRKCERSPRQSVAIIDKWAAERHIERLVLIEVNGKLCDRVEVPFGIGRAELE